MSSTPTTPSSSPLTFGPPTSQWHYNRTTRTYDLTRSSAKKLTIATTAGPEAKISIDPAISVLVVVDMQNFFLSPKCRDHPLGLAAVEPTIRVLERCREVGVKVIWLNWSLTDKDLTTLPAGVQRGFSRSLIAGDPNASHSGLGRDLGSNQGRCLMAGSWNADIYEPLKKHVKEGDVHVAKNRMSGLWSESQPLWRWLEDDEEGKEKRTLLFTGVNTDQCVGGTLADAYNAGWDCVLLDDCAATTTEGGREVWLRNIAGAYGFVTDSAAFCKAELEEV